MKIYLLSGLCLSFRFWIDTADKQPCIGTGGMIPWKLHTSGKLFHSGLAHKVRPFCGLLSIKELLKR